MQSCNHRSFRSSDCGNAIAQPLTTRCQRHHCHRWWQWQQQSSSRSTVVTDHVWPTTVCVVRRSAPSVVLRAASSRLPPDRRTTLRRHRPLAPVTHPVDTRRRNRTRPLCQTAASTGVDPPLRSAFRIGRSNADTDQTPRGCVGGCWRNGSDVAPTVLSK
jgi:hypothetical protein